MALTDRTAKSPFGSSVSDTLTHFETHSPVQAPEVGPPIASSGELPNPPDGKQIPSQEEIIAQIVTSPPMQAAVTISSSIEVARNTDLSSLLSKLQTCAASVASGSWESAETMAINMAEQQVVTNQSPKRKSRSTRARTTSKPKTVRLARKAKSSRRKDAS